MKLHIPSDRAEDIKKWQTQAYDGAEANVSRAIISTLYDGLLGFLKALLEHAKQEQPENFDYPFLERNLASLFFWGRENGVSQGELDAALQFSHRLRDTVLTLLVSLGDLLGHGLIQVITASEKRQVMLKTSNLESLTEDARLLLEEPSDTVKYSGEDLKSCCISLENTIEGLKLLSSSLEAIADDDFDDEEARAWVELKDRTAYEYFADLISSRFPSADQKLAQALGQSNWDRYQYIQRLRKSAADQPDHVGNDKARSEFHDSGIGGSAPAQSVIADDHLAYAATVVSSRAESSHSRLPPLPEVARSGLPFECEVCNRRLQIKRTKQWKEHIFEDICAYNCIYPDCASTRVLFKDRKAMKNHLESYHDINDDSIPRICPLCCEEISGGRNISLHFARHMEEIALGVLPQSAESEACSPSDDDEAERPPIGTSKLGALSSLGVGEYHWDDTSKEYYYFDYSGTKQWQWVNPTSSPPPDVGDGAPPPLGLSCPYCEHSGRLFQTADQLFIHAKRKHASLMKTIDHGTAAAGVQDAALRMFNRLHENTNGNLAPPVQKRKHIPGGAGGAAKFVDGDRIATPVGSSVPDDHAYLGTTGGVSNKGTTVYIPDRLNPSNMSGRKAFDSTETKLDTKVSTIKCICGYDDDDRITVLCEICDTWQHVLCYYKSAANVPDVHKCSGCNPRPIDTVRLVQRQQQPQNRSTGTHDGVGAGTGASDVSPTPMSNNKKRTRTKTSCTTCRKRYIICDEESPECINCIQGGFICEGYTVLRHRFSSAAQKRK